MADHSSIEWTDATWNPIVGCSIVSPGCTNCYAMQMAARIEAMSIAGTRNSHYFGTTKKVNGNAVWTGMVALAPEHILTAPLRWKKPRRVFVNSMGDLFHESVPDEWIDHVFAVMALSPQHQFQVLTKRAERMRAYCTAFDGAAKPAGNCHGNILWNGPLAWPLPNVWLGVSAERQQEADERIPHLLMTPAAIRFVSCEPLLGPIDLRHIDLDGDSYTDALRICTAAEINAACGHREREDDIPGLDWVICGGESGSSARPMHPNWARSLRDQCQAAGVPFFFKQWGEFVPCRAPVLEWSEPDGLRGVDIVVLPDPGTPDLSTSHDKELRRAVLSRDAQAMARVGKRRAGRLLDGSEHNEWPEVRP